MTSTPIPILIDTDPGIDDAVAIMLAFASPELEVVGITAVAGNVPLHHTLPNALRIVALAGRADVPVHAGCPGPLFRDQVFGKHGDSDGLGGNIVPATTQTASKAHAVHFIRDQVFRAAEIGRPLTICTLGPLTNIALALAHGDLPRGGIARIISMAGAFRALGNRTPWAEFNVLADPHALGIVLGAGYPLQILPLDATFQMLATDDWLDSLSYEGGEIGKTLARLVRVYDRTDLARFGRPGSPLHDPLLIASLIWPDLFKGTDVHVGVETQSTQTLGHVHADFQHVLGLPANAHVVTDIGEAALLERLLARLKRYASSAGTLDTGLAGSRQHQVGAVAPSSV